MNEILSPALACTPSAAPKPMGQLEEQVEYLKGTSESLRSLIGILESELQPILKINTPCDTKEEPAPILVPLVPLAERLANINLTNLENNSNLNDLITRIAL